MIAKAFRLVLILVSLAIVVWSFGDVGARMAARLLDRWRNPVQLTVMHWGNPAEDEIVEDLVAEFMRQNPEVKIIRINAGDFRSKIKTMMSGGSPPDVFYLPPDLLPQFARLGVIEPLDDQLKSLPPALRDDFFPILLDAFRYDVASGVVGKGPLYALPKDFTTAVFYINVDLFEAAGVDWKSIQRNGWTWDEFAEVARRISALRGKPEFAGRAIYGSFFQLWPDTIRNILWTFDGDFFATKPDGTPDFADVALDEPGAQQAMKMIRRLRIDEQTVYNPTGIAKEGGAEFLNGNMGSTGPIGRWMVPTYKGITNFKWDVVPVPRGTTRASQIYYTGWCMSSDSRHKDVAFKLITFLCGREGQIQSARAGLAIPSLKSVAYSDDFLKPDGIPPHNSQLFLDAVEYARLQQLPPEQEWGRILGDQINLSIQTGRQTTEENAAFIQELWTKELESPLRMRQWPKMPWPTILAATAALIGVIGLGLFLKARREKLGALDRAQERAGFLFIAPWIIGFLAFTIGPMIASALLSLSKWSGLEPLGGAEWVSTANYEQLLTRDRTFVQSLKVTAYYVVLGVPLTQVAALFVALLMNSNVRGIAVFRTIFFVPSVVSGAALAMLWLQIYNDDYGLINTTLRPILAHPARWFIPAGVVFGAIGAGMIVMARRSRGKQSVAGPIGWVVVAIAAILLVLGLYSLITGWSTRPPNWFGVYVPPEGAGKPVVDAKWWAIPGFVIMGLWGVGAGMIIYLAGLKGIPQTLYEAARIDGAGPVRQMWNVTLPMLSPLIFFNLVMGIIGSFQIFTQAYTMTGPGPEDSTLFYVLQLYRQAFEFHNMGYASAMAWLLFVLVLILTMLVFRGSRGLVHYEGLR